FRKAVTFDGYLYGPRPVTKEGRPDIKSFPSPITRDGRARVMAAQLFAALEGDGSYETIKKNIENLPTGGKALGQMAAKFDAYKGPKFVRTEVEISGSTDIDISSGSGEIEISGSRVRSSSGRVELPEIQIGLTPEEELRRKQRRRHSAPL